MIPQPLHSSPLQGWSCFDPHQNKDWTLKWIIPKLLLINQQLQASGNTCPACLNTSFTSVAALRRQNKPKYTAGPTPLPTFPAASSSEQEPSGSRRWWCLCRQGAELQERFMSFHGKWAKLGMRLSRNSGIPPLLWHRQLVGMLSGLCWVTPAGFAVERSHLGRKQPPSTLTVRFWGYITW